MLSYQHIYHAGNFADVQKHAILAALIQALNLKPQRYRIMDTHAGRGLYDLGSEEALKTGEFNSGIAHFWSKRSEKTPLSAYLDIVASFNDDDLKIYPGSAKIAQKLMRKTDSLTLIEKHPGEYEELQKSFVGEKNVTIEKKDGFDCLTTKLPFVEQRGLILIDPSYEIKSEYEDLPKRLQQAYKKWPQGLFMIWYPVLGAGLQRKMLAALRQSNIKNMLLSELRLEKPPQESFGMFGSGVIIVNPPFGFETTLKEITAFITDALPGKAEGRVLWIDNEQVNPETGLLSI